MINPALRRDRITSTDVAPIFGVDPYRDGFDVWTGKHGHAPPIIPTKRMLLGKDLEQGIVKAYSRVTGRETQWCDETRVHPTETWMAGTPDAFAGEGRGVDAKLIFWDQRRNWGADARDIPEHITLQAWWLMAVCECDVWDVAALVGEDEPRVYEIERDREAERVVVAKCHEWHRRYVIGDEIPPITGSDAAAVWLQQAFPLHKRPDMRPATEEEIKFLEEYAYVRLEFKDRKRRREEMENVIKLAIGDQEGLEWPGGKFTWRKAKDAQITNWEAVARGLLHKYVPEAEHQALIDLHTNPRAGTRRIWFDSDLLHDMSDAA